MRVKIVKTFPISFRCIALAAVIMISFTACSEDKCNELKTQKLFTNPIVYNGNESINFLHNQKDTHVFRFFNKENYYTPPTRGGNEGDCPTQYQAVKLDIENQTKGVPYLFQFERDEKLSNIFSVGSEHEYYKFTSPSSFYYKLLLFSYANAKTVLGKKYPYVYVIGEDTTNNYIFYCDSGIISIRIDGETWELIP